MTKWLTIRDYEILENCLYSNFLSFEQIHARFFSGKKSCTVSNRLKKLEDKGLIKSQTVGVLIHELGNRRVRKVYGATDSARNALNIPISRVKTIKSPKSYVGLYHDIILNDVLYLLSQDPELSAELITSNTKGFIKSDIKPDGLIFKNLNERPIALELELTAKSEKRYEDIFYKYQFSNEFSSVLYVCGNEIIKNKIKKVLKNIGLNTGGEFIIFKNLNEYL